MNKTLIFDWSGTLMDNFHGFQEICNKIFDACNVKNISKEEIKKYIFK